jgi:hypothetical protein
MRDTRDYKHTIAKGLWKDIRDEVTKEYKGRWTQALLVVLHGGYKSIWEEGHENTDWEPVEYDRLAFINLRGNAITEGWKHSFADSEFTADNSDFLVMIHLNSDLRYTPGRSRNQKWAQPLFRINDPFDEDGETPLEKYEDNVAIAEQLFWDEWVPYAKEIWEAPNYPTPNPLVEDNPETEEEEEEDQEEYEESRYDRPRDVRPHEHDPEEEYEEEEEEELPPPRRTRSTTTKAKAKAGATKPKRATGPKAKAGATKPKRATGPKAKAGATKPKRATGPKAKTGSRRKKVDDLPPPAQQPTRKVDDKLPAPIDPEDLPF